MGTGHNLSLRHIAKSEDEFIGMKSSMFQSNKCLESKSTKKVDVCFQPGSNRRPCACEAHVITTTLRKLCDGYIQNVCWSLVANIKKSKDFSSHLGIEPRTFGLEVQRAILCANGTPHWMCLPIHDLGLI